MLFFLSLSIQQTKAANFERVWSRQISMALRLIKHFNKMISRYNLHTHRKRDRLEREACVITDYQLTNSNERFGCASNSIAVTVAIWL